jgi:hypothetical protein
MVNINVNANHCQRRGVSGHGKSRVWKCGGDCLQVEFWGHREAVHRAQALTNARKHYHDSGAVVSLRMDVKQFNFEFKFKLPVSTKVPKCMESKVNI